ncbi:hypothetical protein OHA72_34660 [Dactylosporangium sp. NBC_01737]|uniref:hypothetical protein n=1 Tax=Dactylosporangium sp. NBC_01737 TaxID=2975959 RepID=UPI002E0FC3E2|nr:hypothetical protein OHA72_34660 [Dactylosporangium sp. NBC_01737]
MSAEIRALAAVDPGPIAEAFAAVGWPGKSVEQHDRHLDEQAGGARAVLVATVGGRFAGYLTVCWASGYAPFREAGIAEIVDLARRVDSWDGDRPWASR